MSMAPPYHELIWEANKSKLPSDGSATVGLPVKVILMAAPFPGILVRALLPAGPTELTPSAETPKFIEWAAMSNWPGPPMTIPFGALEGLMEFWLAA